jgi:hypothetical protein
MAQDNGLVKRGLFLLALMATLIVVVLSVVFQRPATSLPAFASRPELTAALLARPDVPFPGAVDWPALVQIAETFPSRAGWQIRYNAAGALARRGSPNPPWGVLLEMLDEDRQMHNFRVQLHDGKVVPDEAAARMTMINALRAIADWHKKHEKRDVSPELAKVYATVDKLAANSIMDVKTQAENTRQLFFR